MSANFSQLVGIIDRTCKTNTSSYPLADKTVDINLALDKVFDIIFQNSGTWQFDDSNQTDYPIITTNIVSGQRDYSFTTDGSGNLILDIFKVMIKTGTASTNYYTEIFPVDQKSVDYPYGFTNGFWNGQNLTGIPTTYAKTANGIFLDCIPNYSVAAGIKIFVNREASYFIVSDTTKKPGFAGLFHEYLALSASYKYARTNGMEIAGGRLRNGAFTGLLMEINDMEDKIANYYSQRTRDEKQQIITKFRNSR